MPKDKVDNQSETGVRKPNLSPLFLTG